MKKESSKRHSRLLSLIFILNYIINNYSVSARWICLAYGGWVRSTCGSQKLGVLPKGHENSLFFSPLAKIKTMEKLLYPLLIINWKIPDLIWRRTTHFVQNKVTVIQHGHARRTTTSRQIRSLETHDVSYFSLFAMWNGFGNCKSPFVNISCHLKWERCLISMPFLSTYIDVRTLNFFPPAESWLVNSNYPRASRMQGEREMVNCQRGP